MTRSELTATIAKRFPALKHDDAEVSVLVILDAITNTLAQGDRAEIRGFGSFSLNYRPPRTGRNPKTGAKVEVPEKWSPTSRLVKNFGRVLIHWRNLLHTSSNKDTITR
jgi:integration host factor subunit beta